ncbi:hypothetical protein ACIBCD_33955 [Nocardia brasiliensis]|uniref:hypothetical protein n=1 Tax=Nocardia brasiliensis TaxID=37326 RepID=UPI00378A5DB0
MAGLVVLSALLACSSGQQADQHGTAAAALDHPPTVLRWVPFHGVDLPVTDQGPASLDGAVARGFDHGPAGAALAAIHSTVRMSLATDNQWARVGQHMLAPGPGRDHWATLRVQISITSAPARDIPELLGYRITHYTPAAADVEIYSLFPDNSLTCNRTQMIWHDEDWRLLLPEDSHINPVSSIDRPPTEMVALTPR